MDLNRKIDHTLLKADATESQIRQLVEEAKEYHFYSCCVNSYYVPLVHQLLKDSEVKTTAVIGFPLGAMSTQAKVAETADAIENGADEIDMVIAIGPLKDHQDALVRQEIAQIKETVGKDRVLKVIIETALLTQEEKIRACQLALAAGADFVKTSTGFSSAGAKVEDVRLMKETVGDRAQVKAAGGIHSYAEALALVEAGASRLGTSASLQIIRH